MPDSHQIITRAADLLEQRGWVQATQEDNEGRLCVYGALRVAAAEQVEPHDDITVPVFEASSVVAAQIRLAYPDVATGVSSPWGTIVVWNDGSPYRSKADAVQLLREAAHSVEPA